MQVLDENDHIPLTVEPVYWVHVAENSPPRTPVVRITALDGDRHSKLTFQLKAGNPQSLFDIDPNSGRLLKEKRNKEPPTPFEAQVSGVVLIAPDHLILSLSPPSLPSWLLEGHLINLLLMLTEAEGSRE